MKEEYALFQSKQEGTEALRNRAIDLYLQGKRPAEIARELGRSRKWFYETLARYQQEGRGGLGEQSRRPHQTPRKTAPEIEAAVVRIRKLIVSGKDPVLRYGNYGAEAIAAELRRAGLEPPSRATIYRILHRHGLVEPRPKRRHRQRLPQDYPWPSLSAGATLHVMDFMMRTLPGGQRFYAANLLEMPCQWPYLAILPAKTRDLVCSFFVAAWQAIGIPDVLQVDNDNVWRGSSSAPYTFSFLVRLWLLLGVQVIFIPPYTPQANTWIESFNHLWGRNFWQRTRFQSLKDVQQNLPYFQTYCRERRLLPGTEITPHECRSARPAPLRLPDDFNQYRQKRLPLTEGFLHFIRFADAHGNISFLNASWPLGPQWAGKTVRATLDTKQGRVIVFYQATRDSKPQSIAAFSFPIREEVLPVAERFRRLAPSIWPEATS